MKPESITPPCHPGARSPEQLERYLRDARDYWFHVYRPREGDVIVDIGAGRGEDVYAFSLGVGPKISV